MNDKRKNKSELINELNALRRQLAVSNSLDESAIKANLASDHGGGIGMGDHKPMSARRRFAILALIMIMVCAITMSVVLVILFNQDIQDQRAHLQTTVQSQARLMEAVARYDSRVSDFFYDENPEYDAFAATMSQIIDAHEKYEGFGVTGEFTLARRNGDKIDFVMRHRFDTIDQPESVAFDSELAEPMRRALTGLAGTVIGLDYRGRTVLAAYEPVAGLNLGIVAKIDLAEIRAPFIKSGITAAVIAFFVILVGTVIFFWISNPLITRLEAHAKDLQAELELRRRSEKALQVSEARFRTLFETSPDGVTIDQNGILIYANPAYQQMYGFENLQNQLGKSYATLIAPQDLDRVLAISAAREAGEAAPVTYEFTGMRTDGTEFPVEVTAAPFEHDGQAATMAILRDITKRKLAEEALIVSNERFKLIASDAPIPIMIHAEDGEILQISKAWTDLSGYSHDDIPSIANWTEQAYGERMVDVRSIIDAVFERNTIAYDGEFIITTKSKQNRLWDFSSGPIGRLPDGRRLMMSMASDITERNQAEEALRKSEERYRSLVETSQDLIWECDSEGRFIYLNPAWEQVTGYKLNEMLGKPFTDFIHKEKVERNSAEFAKHLEGGFVKGFQSTYISKAGSEIALIFNAIPLFNKDKIIIGTQGSAYDITERKQAEEALKESEQEYQNLFKSMREGFALVEVICDKKGKPKDYRFLNINPAFEEQSGMDVQTTIGRTIREIYPDIEDTWIERYGGVALNQRPIHFENYNHNTDRYFDVTAFSPSKGKCAMLFREITVRKQAEEALRESESKFRDFFDNAPVGFHIFDSDGIIIDINKTELDLIGYSREEIVGKKTWGDLIIPEQISQYEDHWKSINTTGFVQNLEYTLRTDSDELIMVLLNATARFDQSGRLINTRGSVLDISRRKQAEQIKEELYLQVVESQTKLEALSGQLVTAQETERRHLARELHDEIGQEMCVISLKLGQILDSNIDSELGSELTNIRVMVESTLENIRHLSRELRPSILDDLGLEPAIRWLFKRQAKLREGFIPTINARGLKKRLAPNMEIVCYRIVQEALTNIMKHAQASRVTLILEEVGDRLHIKMEDNGCGFDVDAAMKKATSGETMGLLSMEERAISMGGKLEITSQISKGTIIEGYIPLKSSEAEDD